MIPYRAKPEDGAAWVTGASSGIGKALALMLAKRGFTVFATARSKDELEKLVQQASGLSGSVVAAQGDVTDAARMAEIVGMIETGHGLALAVFNAGIYIPVHGETLRLEDFDKTFAVNLSGVTNGLVPALAPMNRRGRGQVVIVSSVTGYGGMPTSAAYGATKAALINMAESLKFDLDKTGVTVQVVNPGFVDTPATSGNAFTMPALMTPDAAAEAIADGIEKAGFEITFPKRFTYALKGLNLLPYSLYFALMNAGTGWKKRPLETTKPSV